MVARFLNLVCFSILVLSEQFSRWLVIQHNKQKITMPRTVSYQINKDNGNATKHYHRAGANAGGKQPP
jgi:hypothetical protein